MTDLLPCPFCGKAPEYVCEGDHHGEFFRLGCPDEDCTAHWAYYTEPQENADQCIRRWNTRATDPRSSERCDAGWQPIETAPFVSAKRYMLTSHHRIPFVGFRYYENGPWLDEHGHFQKPTHWRELPDTSCIDVVSSPVTEKTDG